MKKLLPILAAPLFAISAFSSVLTPEQALERIQGDGPMRIAAKNISHLKLVHTAKTLSGNPAVYVFNRPSDAGFLIVSADDVAYPMLGYADSGSVDTDNMPPSMKWWLQEYGRQIEFASNLNSGKSASPVKVNGKEISPLVTTKWNQGKPYNNECPRINGIRCVTGCVATAMAQIMNYHKYPERGTGQVNIYLPETKDPISLKLSEQAFDWANMLDEYAADYTPTQADAVAYLMKACGYSVDMKYSTTESGASSFNIGNALINHFSYNPNISFEERKFYDTSEWEQMVYDELAANRPVLYSGQSEGGGHAFICDGFKENGYFHINWGWGGTSDGYFLLQSLNPEDLGVGGGTGGGFSFEQGILKGVQPSSQGDSPTPRLYQYGNLRGSTFSTSKMSLSCYGDNSGWWNFGYNTITINMGVIIEPLNISSAKKTEVIASSGNDLLKDISLTSLRGLTSFTFQFPTDYPDGKYKVTVATQDATTKNAPWVPVKCEICYSNSATVTKNGNRYNIEYQKSKSLTVDSCEILSPFYYGSAVRLRIKASNNNDVELTQNIAPVLSFSGKDMLEGTGIPLSLKPGESITKEIVMSFNPEKDVTPPLEPMTLTLNFINLDNGELLDFSTAVLMKPKTGHSIEITDLKILDADYETVAGQRIYNVADPNDINLSAVIECNAGYFGYPIIAFVFPERGGSSLSYVEMTPEVTISQGEKQEIGGKIFFSQGAEGAKYMIQLYYADSNMMQIKNAKCFFKINTAGVDRISTADGIGISFDPASKSVTASSESGIASISVTDLSGKSYLLETNVDGETARASLSGLQRGIYIVSATDSNGASRSIKVAL